MIEIKRQTEFTKSNNNFAYNGIDIDEGDEFSLNEEHIE